MRKRFAEGCNFYKLFWIFLIGGLIGDVTETVYCRFSMGTWMSRSSVLYGPFSIVWGLGAVVLTMTLHRLRKKKDVVIFFGGFLIGGVYEYICSVFTEKVLGTSFWSYREIPFNIDGRINLLFCLFWGLLSLVWIKEIYPRLSVRIERIPCRFGRPLTWALAGLMAVNMLLSASAIVRTVERQYGVPVESEFDRFLDRHYPDERIARRYRNMKLADGERLSVEQAEDGRGEASGAGRPGGLGLAQNRIRGGSRL